MAGVQRYTAPTNKIIVFNPYAKLPTTMCSVQTDTDMCPGNLVKRYSTTDNQIIVNTVNNPPLGWLGYEETNPKYTNEASMLVTGTYAADDIVAVHNGPGVVWMGNVATHNYMGDPLCAAAAGELTTALATSVTIPSGGTSVLSCSSVPTFTFAGAIPGQGPIVAIAEADINDTFGPCRSLI